MLRTTISVDNSAVGVFPCTNRVTHQNARHGPWGGGCGKTADAARQHWGVAAVDSGYITLVLTTTLSRCDMSPSYGPGHAVSRFQTGHIRSRPAHIIPSLVSQAPGVFHVSRALSRAARSVHLIHKFSTKECALKS